MSEKLLVTGAAGKLGRSVVSLLIEEFGVAATDIIATTRDPAKLADLAARGVIVRAADFDKPETLPTAFAGADRLLLISTDSLGVPGQRLVQHRTAIAAAKAAGVKAIVYTSAANPHGDNHPLFFAGDHAGTETAIIDSGLPYRILRNYWYQENLLMSLPSALASGTWYTSEAADTRVAYVAHDDCARAAASALTKPWNGDHATYDITGDESLTADEIAAIAATTLGKPIAVVHLSRDALAKGLEAAGLPPVIVGLTLSLEATNNAGLLAKTSDAVKTLTGHKPRSLATFFAANRTAFGA